MTPRIRNRTLASLLSLLFASPALLAQPAPTSAPSTQPATRPASLSDRITQRCQEELTRQRLVGLSIALARESGVFHTAHFGYEDRERQIAASDDTMYRWASVSKPVTAVAMMQLHHQGKLDLDADIRTLVPEFPDKGQRLTARLLATHQAGIPHYTNGKIIPTKRTYAEEHPFESVILALDKFNQSPLVFEPGEKHSYSTYGYILLGAVVERAAGQPFARVVHDRISTPLGLTTLQPDYQWVPIDHRAVGYRKKKDAEPTLSTNTDVSWKLPGGGFISNIRDMAAFGAGLLGDRLLDADSRTLMWTPQPTRAAKPTTYALGFGVGQLAGLPIYAHSGGQEKTATYLVIMPATPRDAGGLACAIMCNTEGAALRDLARDLLSAAIEDRTGPLSPEPPAPPP